ncbi:MAG: helix-turn-helix transcriptional regulator [Ruminococcaceae bacterium]|nr:helix-turn-helix transcriptional regulator [Oscillospiraceae bacterium]
MLIHQPNEPHALATSDAVAPSVIIIGFTCDSPELYPFSCQPVTLSSDQIKALSRILQEGMSIFEPPYNIPNTAYMPKRTHYPFGADQLIKIGLESLLISLVRDIKSDGNSPVNTTPTGIQAVHQYISKNYHTRITLDSLCFLFGINKTTLCRSFKESYGTTILDYINALRIQEATVLLHKSNSSITEISEILGFSSVHYFCRLFKQHTHCSPTAYAKASRVGE